MKPPLIALYSPVPQSGKSTVATFLGSCFYRKLSIAHPLKRMMGALLDEMGYEWYEAGQRMVYGDMKEVPLLGVRSTPRQLMQTLGTEWGRNTVHPDIWINIAVGKARKAIAEGSCVVIDDLRFPNELARIREVPGAEVWGIVRPGLEYVGGHASEGLLDIDALDRIIVNDGDKDALRDKVFKAMADATE